MKKPRHPDVSTMDDLIQAFGGPAVLADRLGIGQSAISMWKARERIPPGWHLMIVAELQRMGLTVDMSLFGFDGDPPDIRKLSA
jgi:hypothetical protein